MVLDPRLAMCLQLNNSTFQSVHDIAVKPRARENIAGLLGQIEFSYWKELGGLLVRDPSSRVRGRMAEVLGSHRVQVATDLLDKLASDGVWQVRYKAALGAGGSGTKEALAIISKLLKDENAKVRAAAVKGLLDLCPHYPEATLRMFQMEPLQENALSTLQLMQDVLAGVEGLTSEARKNAAQTGQEPYFCSLPDVEIELNTLLSEFNISFIPEPEVDICSNLPTTGSKNHSLASAINITSPSSLSESDTESSLEKSTGGPGGGDRNSILDDAVNSTRYVNTWFEGHPHPLEPLRFAQEYQLGIEVSPKLRVGSLTKGRPEFHEPDFGEEETLDIVVAIVTDDFEVLEKPAKRMRLSKDRTKSSPTVTFKVKPVNNNQDVFITIVFYHKNNLFHEACLGARVQVMEPLKRTDSSAYFPTENRLIRPPNQSPRDMNLQVIEMTKDYRLILFYDFGPDNFGILWCRIPITRDRVADLLKGVRDDMVEVVHTKGIMADGRDGQVFYDGEAPPFPLQQGRLPEMFPLNDLSYREVLKRLAKAGRKLYVNLFDPVKGRSEERKRARQVGKTLMELSANRELRIQVLSDDFFIPWNLLYTGAYSSNKVDTGGFWGFKHIIEEIPYRTQGQESDLVIPVEETGLKIGMNINCTNIQEVLTKSQLSRIEALKSQVKMSTRFSEEEVIAALSAEEGQPQLEYFYCHAGTAGDPQKDFDRSYLGLTQATTGLTLEDIKLATVGLEFQNNPMFILNACASAQMD
jgi:hypothetical protein